MSVRVIAPTAKKLADRRERKLREALTELIAAAHEFRGRDDGQRPHTSTPRS